MLCLLSSCGPTALRPQKSSGKFSEPSHSFQWIRISAPYLGEGNGTPLQYSCLENLLDGGAWRAAVHGVATSWMWLGDFTFTFHFHILEKEVATHSSVVAWRIPGTGETGGLPSMGSHRVRQDWSDLAAAAVYKTVWSQRELDINLSQAINKLISKLFSFLISKMGEFLWKLKLR